MLQWSVVGGRERHISEAMNVVTEQGVGPRLGLRLSTVEDESESRVYRCRLLSAMPFSRNLVIQLLVLKPRVLEFLPVLHPTASQLSQLQE